MIDPARRRILKLTSATRSRRSITSCSRRRHAANSRLRMRGLIDRYQVLSGRNPVRAGLALTLLDVFLTSSGV